MMATIGNNEAWAVLQFKLYGDWPFMDFETLVRVDTPVCVLESTLKRMHGPIVDLVMCAGEFSPKNELRGDMKALTEFGIHGGAKANPPRMTIRYNFKPADWENPDNVLL